MNKDQPQYQDPLLNPGQLRQIVKNLPSKIKHPHTDYKHRDAGALLDEIDEFFSYVESANALGSYRSDFNDDFGKEWQHISDQEKRKWVEQLLDQLDQSSVEQRTRSARHLTYIALGAYNNDSQELSDMILSNNTLLYSCGALSSVFQAFKSACSQHDTQNAQHLSGSDYSALTQEIEQYITIMYLIIEALRNTDHFTYEGNLDPAILQHLFSIVSQLRDKYIKSFPVKKLVLLLWKVILTTFGGAEQLKESKAAARKMYGLDSDKHDMVSKCTPQDLYTFQNEITLKYPTYTPPHIPLNTSSTLTIKASPALATAMGISNSTARTDLPYQTLFPPKSATGNNTNSAKRLPQQQSLVWPTPSSQSFVLPLSETEASVPKSTVEAGELYVQNMYLSLANHQVMLEREKAIHRWKRKQEQQSNQDEHDEEEILLSHLNDSMMRKRFEALEQTYAVIVPELQNIVIVLLKLLLSTVAMGNISSNKQPSHNTDGSQKSLHQNELDEADAARNREILSKAISAVIFLLLKWTKVSHVLKFEFISQLLVDSGCLLLILKILGLQEITNLVAAKTDVEGCSFSEKITGQTKNITSIPEQNYTNTRNMFWSINFLRILQMLTKRKTHRIMLLVQYKSSAILKRILKVSHPVMELYTLKVLKSQVPYLGRKWRSLNMKIVSAIYLRCHTVLKDDWISKSDTDSDMEDGMIQEINLRMLVRIYNGQRYLPSMLPQQDEPSGLDTSALTTPLLEEDISLDPEFMSNYEEWLEKNVYNVEWSEDNEDIALQHHTSTTMDNDDKQPPGTPIPSSPVIQGLATQINDLYHKELEREFSLENEDTTTIPTNPFEFLTHRLVQVEQNTLQRWSELNSDQQKALDSIDGL
ncbi:N1221-domain-containing protein [Lichtheimia hyalospora FSU 10163]|nr:N1221-domain-containing protein [Lichtheimia hyalospora FSU 10163]